MTQIMKVRWVVGWVVVLMLVAAIGYAQEAPIRQLSIADALSIARQSNPDYLMVLNDRWGASAAERSSFLNLFTPSVSASAGQRRTQEGTTVITGIATPFTSPANTSGYWSLNGTYTLSGSTIANRGLATANARATEADIDGALRTLETNVRTQYLILLQTKAQAELARRSVERAQEALSLSQARYQVGQATLIDVRSSEVDKGTADVNLLTANQAVENQTLVLFQALGVPAPEPIQLELTDSFPVTEPAFAEDSLIRMALAENPALVALRAREASARWSTRSAYSQYLPSLQLSANYGGYRQANDAYTTQYTDSTGTHSVLVPPSSNNGTSPFSFSIGVSIPIYDAFSRATSIQQARAAEDDLNQSIRSRELAVRASVAAAYRGLIAAYQKIGLQQSNKGFAAEALDLAQQRYRVGSGTYLELLNGRVTADQADASYVTAVYDYHKAIATLESAVGRPLR
ncbi:MAG: TolC family protein [Gemmatimonadales bacterium]